MIQAFTVDEIRAAEAVALAGVTDDALMKRAANEIAIAVVDRIDRPLPGQRVVLLVGSGNNGGDALYAGALLRRRGLVVTAVLISPGAAHPGGLATLLRRGGRVIDATDGSAHGDVAANIDGAQVIIDGVVGLGARPPLRAPASELVEMANRSEALRVAVDLPSGIEADTGRVVGTAFQAHLTVTFGGLKPGLLIADAQAGVVVVADLGMMPQSTGAALFTMTDGDVASMLADPGPGDDKFSSGVLGIVAGSTQYPGAAVLCTGGAVRLRPGMVRYAGPQAVAVVQRWPEVVASEEPSEAGQVQAWVVGPGMGSDEAAKARLAAVMGSPHPVVVDADGLTLLAADPSLLADRRDRTTVLTPHSREFTRLFPDLEPADRLASVRQAAQRSGAIVLLKGHRTVIAAPDGRTAVNTTGSSWLATAGSGDVLSGIIGSLLAGGAQPLEAAAAGAHLHGRAGERARTDRAAGADQLLDRLQAGQDPHPP